MPPKIRGIIPLKLKVLGSLGKDLPNLKIINSKSIIDELVFAVPAVELSDFFAYYFRGMFSG